jgi:hypothetical protein
VASLAGIGMVGTETGAPNAAYKLDANTHTREALDTFLHNLEPVVACAEQYGVTMAIEPVWNHIVYDADRALEVIRGMESPSLRIIFDPVNLLCMENADDRERVFGDAMDKLCDYIAFLHKGQLLLNEEKDALYEEYGLLRCDLETLRTLDPKAIIGKKETPYGAEVILRREAAGNLTLSPIGIEELFVFMVKGGEAR